MKHGTSTININPPPIDKVSFRVPEDDCGDEEAKK